MVTGQVYIGSGKYIFLTTTVLYYLLENWVKRQCYLLYRIIMVNMSQIEQWIDRKSIYTIHLVISNREMGALK